MQKNNIVVEGASRKDKSRERNKSTETRVGGATHNQINTRQDRHRVVKEKEKNQQKDNKHDQEKREQ